jgi:integrase
VDADRDVAILQELNSGRSDRRVSAQAVALTAEPPRKVNSAYAFPGKIDGQPPEDLQRLRYAIRCYAALEDVWLHDLRHSMASFAADKSVSLPVVGNLLAHSDHRSTTRYAHIADDALRAAAASVASEIHEALQAGSGSGPSGNHQTKRLMIR